MVSFITIADERIQKTTFIVQKNELQVWLVIIFYIIIIYVLPLS
jgi:hypothetical protein